MLFLLVIAEPGTEMDADGAVSTGQVLYSSGAALATTSSRGPAARAKQLAEVRHRQPGAALTHAPHPTP